MKRTVLLLGLTLAAGVMAGVIGAKTLNAQQELVKATVLLKTDLTGVEGKEGLVVLVEHAPGANSGKHYHPGHEFAYILEGSAILEQEGKPPVRLQAGNIIYYPPKEVHEGKNASTTAPLKVLVFQVNEKGQPFLVPVD
ncbi:MAG TPA: cupin domain-containing protein [Candidatus Methylomirabilis sp.]|nr:cupin domain-containing protein [Candidatus Methylomirabilis sp.]